MQQYNRFPATRSFRGLGVRSAVRGTSVAFNLPSVAQARLVSLDLWRRNLYFKMYMFAVQCNVVM